ncbi:MAG: DUF4157 domain-containing protein [Caldilinea sp. CFX5]|nr:DUF4157 domain-containing protein [Caldilinea sp. CFX5]
MWELSPVDAYIPTVSHPWLSWQSSPRPGGAQALSAGRALPHALRTLQRSAGNQRVSRLLAANQQSNHAGQGQPAATPVDAGSLSARTEQAPTLATPLHRRLPGRPLPAAVRADLEERFQADLARVRIHTDSQARRTATHLAAAAFTVGSDIFFGAGQYDPTSLRGRRLLAHELAHVLQQSRQRAPAPAFVLGHAADRYEREAAFMTRQLVQPGALQGTRRQPLKIRERWRGPGALISRQAAKSPPQPQAESVDALLLAAGITRAQALAIQYWYLQAQAAPRSAEWRRCYLACQLATRCGLPPLHMLDLKALKKALDAFVGKADWEQILTSARGRACLCDAAAAPAAGQSDRRGLPAGATR